MVRVFLLALLLLVSAAGSAQIVPPTEAHSLDGRTVRFPVDLQRSTVLVLGFSRSSSANLTTWDKALRADATNGPAAFYDIPVLAAVPEFARAFVVKSIRREIPAVARPSFLTISDHEAEWKQAARFDTHAPDAAYVLLVNNSGQVLWQTHEAYSAEQLAALRRAWSGAR